jgi:hypothetical protein
MWYVLSCSMGSKSSLLSGLAVPKSTMKYVLCSFAPSPQLNEINLLRCSCCLCSEAEFLVAPGLPEATVQINRTIYRRGMEFRFVTVRHLLTFVKYQVHENFWKHRQKGTLLTTQNRFPKMQETTEDKGGSVLLIQVWTEVWYLFDYVKEIIYISLVWQCVMW